MLYDYGIRPALADARWGDIGQFNLGGYIDDGERGALGEKAHRVAVWERIPCCRERIDRRTTKKGRTSKLRTRVTSP